MMEVGVDIGGTFTDVVIVRDETTLYHAKAPSTPPDLLVGVRDAVAQALRMSGSPASQVDRFVHGSTVATNAVLERRGSSVGLLTTAGFEDTIEIGRQKRSQMYELLLKSETPHFLAPRRQRLGIPERIAANGSVVLPLDEDAVRRAVRRLVRREKVEALAVCYLFSFANDTHEARTREIADEEAPGVPCSLSSQVDPTFREYERTVVTAFDAYLHGLVASYIRDLQSGLADFGIQCSLQIMQSRGGISSAEAAASRPVTMLLSGLAAGVIGARHVAEESGFDDIVSVDIGGTSCDVALVQHGKPLVATEGSIDGYPLRLPMVDVSTVGAGGGSIAWTDGAGSLRVGPQSAGADPGPACYGRGGREVTVTDASVVLGYLNPNRFAGGGLQLDPEAAHAALHSLGARLGLGPTETAAGIHAIVNARMAEQIRLVTIRRGHDPRRFALLGLGGAGPLHLTELAADLGILRCLVPVAPGVLSAFGLLVANVEHHQALTVACSARELNADLLRHWFRRLDREVADRMANDVGSRAAATVHHLADMRYRRQSYELPIDIDLTADDPVGHAVGAFHAAHEQLYGARQTEAEVEVINVRTVHSSASPKPKLSYSAQPARTTAKAQHGERPAYFRSARGFVDTVVLDRSTLATGTVLTGPAIVEQSDTTTVVPPEHQATVLASGVLVVEATG